MDLNLLRGLMTLVVMLLFIALCIGIYSKKNKAKFDLAARMALENNSTENDSNMLTEHTEQKVKKSN